MTSILNKTLASCLLDLLYSIETASEDEINEDFSVNLLESVGAEIQTLNRKELSEFMDVVSNISIAESDPKRRVFLDELSENFGLDNGLV